MSLLNLLPFRFPVCCFTLSSTSICAKRHSRLPSDSHQTSTSFLFILNPPLSSFLSFILLKFLEGTGGATSQYSHKGTGHTLTLGSSTLQTPNPQSFNSTPPVNFHAHLTPTCVPMQPLKYPNNPLCLTHPQGVPLFYSSFPLELSFWLSTAFWLLPFLPFCHVPFSFLLSLAASAFAYTIFMAVHFFLLFNCTSCRFGRQPHFSMLRA